MVTRLGGITFYLLLGGQMDCVLRFAKENELPLIWEMYEAARSYDGCVWGDNYPDKEILLDDFNKNNLCVFVLKNKIIGAISIEFDDYLDDAGCWKVQSDKSVSFARVVIAKDFLGQGYGTKMVEKLLNVFQENDWDVVRILVSPYNKSAMSIYKKLGFDFICVREFFEKDFWLCEKVLKERTQ